MIDGSPDLLEAHRARLEESLDKLRKALKIWQEQSAEYEGLREELLALSTDATRQDMLAIAKDFGGSIITEKEIASLLGNGRNTKQVADAVGRRIDYVQDNVKQVQKQLDKGEERLTAVEVIMKPDQVTNEEGLPMMEIREELDEDGNVIESSVDSQTNARAIPLDLEALKSFKPFLDTKVVDEKNTPLNLKDKTLETTDIAQSEESDASRLETILDKNKPDDKASILPSASSTITKSTEKEPHLNGYEKPEPVVPHEGIASIKIQSDDEDDYNSDEDFANAPEVEEDEYSAQMRRDMIKYNLNEIGAIVAEIDLEEGEDYDYSDDDDMDTLSDADEKEEEEEEDESEEDEHGRSLSRGVSARIQREMQALQDKIRAREDDLKKAELDRVNAGEKQQQQENVEEIVTPGAKKSHKKGVRFAEELDISPAPRDPDFVAEEDIDDTELDPNILDMVFGPGTKDAEARMYQNTADAPKPKGPSLFKASKMLGKAMEKPDPSLKLENNSMLERVLLKTDDLNRQTNGTEKSISKGKAKASKKSQSTASIQAAAILANTKEEESEQEDDKPILADTIVERPPAKQTIVNPPDELDSNVVRQEIATSYQQMKNRRVQRQGGYTETDEEKQFVPLNEDGEKKKISRFKARMAKG